MPKSLKDLFLDKDYNIQFVEKPAKEKNIVNTEKNPNGVLVKFAKELPKIYGTDLVRIESRGSIDPARTIAVRSVRPVNTKGGGFGRIISNLLGAGDAHRPSDTIFYAGSNGDGLNSPPVSKNGQPINGDWSELKYAVDENIDYANIAKAALKYKGPSDVDKFFNGLAKGNNPTEMAQQAVGKAITAAQNLITKGANDILTAGRSGGLKKLAEKRKNKNKFEIQNPNIKEFTNLPDTNGGQKIINSNYFKTYGEITGNPELDQNLINRDRENIKSFNYIVDNHLLKVKLTDDELQKLAADNLKTQVAYLKIKQIGFDDYIVFPAAINGVSEQINPEWDTFKYVGSPFNSYRYRGVNRRLSFGLQVYHLGAIGNNPHTKGQEMKQKLNRLRELAFPYNSLNKITYGNKDVSGLTFVPNLIELSLGDYYQNLNGFIDSMTIGVPDNVSWPTNDPNLNGAGFVYPTLVNVQFSMTIVENHLINKTDNKITYRFTDVIDVPGA